MGKVDFAKRGALAQVAAALLLALLAAGLLGAPSAVAATETATTEDGATTWQRIWGDDALGTMAAIAEEGFASADTVIVATKDGYWDALSASSLAGACKAPVLLTDGTRLSSEAKAQIDRLRPTRAYICGGPASVNENVQTSLEGLVGASAVKRLGGSDAPETALLIASETFAVLKANGESIPETCVITASSGYWDALSASPYSYALHAPIYLTGPSGLSASARADIEANGFKRAIVCGGEMTVPKTVEAQLSRAKVAEVTREAGKSAYETSAHMASRSLLEGMSVDGMGVATASGYWDAVTGAALCGSRNTVLVLADDGNRTAVDEVYMAHREKAKKGFVFGGPASVTEETWRYLLVERAPGT